MATALNGHYKPFGKIELDTHALKSDFLFRAAINGETHVLNQLLEYKFL